MTIKRYLKALCPPAALDLLEQTLDRKVQFSGNYSTWSAASNAATGYDSASILERAIAATHQVISGEAISERDGITFHHANYPYPLIACLLMAAAENKGELTVLDFGGALGSTYLQCRYFLKSLKYLRWCIVEQQHFVAAGRLQFTSDQLAFYQTISEVYDAHKPNVALFSGSLQYLPEPYAVLRDAIDRRVDYIVVDRNPFIESATSAITLQKIPRQIIESSYPLWLFSESEFRAFLDDCYVEVASFDALDGTIGRGRLKANFKGMVFKKKTSAQHS